LSTTDHGAIAAIQSTGAGFNAARRCPQSVWALRVQRLPGVTSVRAANIEILLRQVVFLVLLTRASCDPLFDLSGVSFGGSQIGIGAAINALVITVAFVFAIRRISVTGSILAMWGPYLALAFLATIYAPDTTTAGRAFFVVLTYAAMFALPLFMFRSPADLRRFILLILASSIVPSIFAVLELRNALSDADDFRLQSTFSHPNIFAFYLVLLIGLALYIRTSKAVLWSPRIRTIVYAYIPALLVFLAMTKTRSAWAACAMMLLVYAIWFERRLLFAGILVVPILLSSYSVVGDRLADLSEGSEIENFSELNAEVRLNSLAWRQALWESALPSIQAKPVLGHGLESFRPATPTFFALVGPQGIDAHNLYLQIAFEMGMAGLLVFGWLIVSVARRLWRGRRYDSCGIVVICSISAAYLIESYADNMIYYLSFNWYFMFAIGTVCAWISYREERDRAERRSVG
jgi:O-antigen ligase